ncbi:CoA transferase [Leucobacter komagatae]|uniref:CoA transferase n=1 Tax=Leucobacter komagatae TaxID=55969 RepID=UPI000A05E304|nr:CoA transferase [Leucobacter komagatae]
MSHTLPLHGVRVTSLALNVPGPIGVARLAALGASVVKIEPPTGDPLAMVAPAWYEELCAGQLVRRLNLKDPTDHAAFEEELASADILVTSLRPSAARRLGLTGIAHSFPKLSVVEIVGSSGERAEAPGHDLTYQAEHGLLTPPALPQALIADLLAAERTVSAALLAILTQKRTGRGDHQRVVIEAAAADAGAPGRFGLTTPDGVLGGGDPAYGIYETADGHVALAALEPHFRRRLAAMVGGSSREALTTAFRSKPTEAWLRRAESADVPLARVHPTAGAAAQRVPHPQTPLPDPALSQRFEEES